MTAVYLIEHGGNRSPLAVAAIGTALGQLIIVVAAVWDSHWRIASGSLLGTAIAVVIYAVVRIGDPECIDPRGHGRSALLIAGCWLGGVGLGPAAIGIAVLIVSYFGCMVAFWMINQGGTRGAGRAEPHFSIGPPLVTALALAMAASLVIRR
jgi:Ca2+/Na+ antiporter